jgi:hypothetical protein
MFNADHRYGQSRYTEATIEGDNLLHPQQESVRYWSILLALSDFKLFNGTREQGNERLESFLRHAFQALRYQSRKIKAGEAREVQHLDQTIYPHAPSIEVALRLALDGIDENEGEQLYLVSESVGSLVRGWCETGRRAGISMTLHLLLSDIGDANEQRVWRDSLLNTAWGGVDEVAESDEFQLFDFIDFSRTPAFDVEHKEVYNRLWIESGFALQRTCKLWDNAWRVVGMSGPGLRGCLPRKFICTKKSPGMYAIMTWNLFEQGWIYLVL